MKKKLQLDRSIKKEISDYIVVLKKNGIKPEKVILFGSFAKNSATEHSDIDLAIISPEFNKNRMSVMAKLMALSTGGQYKIEAIPLSPEFLNQKYDTLASEIRATGKIVYEGPVSNP